MTQILLSDSSFELPNGGQWQGTGRLDRLDKLGFNSSTGYLANVDPLFQSLLGLETETLHQLIFKAKNPRRDVDCSLNIQLTNTSTFQPRIERIQDGWISTTMDFIPELVGVNILSFSSGESGCIIDDCQVLNFGAVGSLESSDTDSRIMVLRSDQVSGAILARGDVFGFIIAFAIVLFLRKRQ